MRKYFLVSSVLVLLMISCKKENETFQSATISDYYPTQVGKYINYDLDSTVFTNFGQTVTVNHYQVQDRFDAAITDNSGRPSYRIIRYIRKLTSEPWTANNTFMVTPTENSIEYVENNMRFIKLKLPIVPDYSWKGNKYIDTYNANTDVRYLDDWDYIYDSVGDPVTINSIAINETTTVLQRDEFLGQDPGITGTQYAEKNYSIEKYGKGIGLIYREFLHWEYQGPQPGRAGYYDGYGIKMTITGHN